MTADTGVNAGTSDAPDTVMSARKSKRAILFSAPMVRAILAGRKRMTRRVVRGGIEQVSDGMPEGAIAGRAPKCPYGEPGSLLLVKEAAWMWCERVPNGRTKNGRQRWRYVPLRSAPVHYAADHPERPSETVCSRETGNHWGWRLKIGRFLPAWASRITLRLDAHRVERLQAIAEGDAELEGVSYPLAYAGPDTPYRTAFARLWDSIHGPAAWSSDPLVWVVNFSQVTTELDSSIAPQHAIAAN